MMGKYLKSFIYIAMMFAFIGFMCTIGNIVQNDVVKTVPLTGLSFHGKPCMVPVPANLPLGFLKHADFLVVKSTRSRDGSFWMLVFAGPPPVGNMSWTITLYATSGCPAFMAIDYYDFKTGKAKYWLYNTKQEVRKVTEEQSVAFCNNITRELAATYIEECMKSKGKATKPKRQKAIDI